MNNILRQTFKMVRPMIISSQIYLKPQRLPKRYIIFYINSVLAKISKLELTNGNILALSRNPMLTTTEWALLEMEALSDEEDDDT